MPPFVHLDVVRNSRPAVRLGRNNCYGAAFLERRAQRVVVERLVAEEGAEFDAGYQRLDADAVVTLARQQDEARHIAQSIDKRDDLGRQAAARAADSLILSPPFAPAPCRWTLMIVPSMSAYSKSGSSESAAKIRSKAPLSAQRRKRFQTVPHLPNASGKSRQGAPARTIHKTASTNSRLSSPDRPGSPSLPGKSGAIRSHCASVKSNRTKAGLRFPALNPILSFVGILQIKPGSICRTRPNVCRP